MLASYNAFLKTARITDLRSFPSPASRAADQRYALRFLATPDIGMSAEALASRYEKGRAGAEQARAVAARHATLGAIHDFLYREHGIYAPANGPPHESA